MRTRRLRALLFTTAIAAATNGIALSAASAETLTDALIQAYQTSPLLASSRAALRSLDESVPQARANRRPQVDANVAGSTGADYGDFESHADALQATLVATLLIYDSGQTKAAIESARNSAVPNRAIGTVASAAAIGTSVIMMARSQRGMAFPPTGTGALQARRFWSEIAMPW